MSEQDTPTSATPEPDKPESRHARRAPRDNRQAYGTGNGIGGVILVLVGLGFLGLNFGWWSTDIWRVIWRFWPVILILLGLRILLPRSRIFSWIILALAVGFFALIISAPPAVRNWTMIPDGDNSRSTQLVSSDLGTTKSLKLELNYGAAEVNIRPLDESSTKLYEANFANAVDIDKRVTTSGDVTSVRLDERGHMMMSSGSIERQVTLYLSRKVPLELKLDIGGAKFTADLSDLQLTRLVLDGGASTANIKFGRLVDRVAADINAGAASLTLRVPEDVGTQIRYDGVFSSQNFEAAGLQKAEDTYTTPDFTSVTKQIKFNLDTGASTIKLERY